MKERLGRDHTKEYTGWEVFRMDGSLEVDSIDRA